MVNRSLTRGRRGKNLFLFADGFQKSASPSNRQVSISAEGGVSPSKIRWFGGWPICVPRTALGFHQLALPSSLRTSLPFSLRA
jgi:hypothetical protein